MDEVVAIARGVDWDENSAPSAMFFREAVAVPGEFQRRLGFSFGLIFLDWQAYVESRSARKGTAKRPNCLTWII